MKELILEILSGQLIGAKDNLKRMERICKHVSLRTKYGESGKTYGQFLKEDQERVCQIQAAIEWVKSK